MDAYWLFTSIWFLAAATPGADTMLLLSTSLATGWRSAVPISIGITVAKILLLLVSYFGLATLLAAVPALFIVLKVFGCVFLIWKAWGLWNAASAVGNASASGFLGNLATSFTVAISNPQALLFYVAVVPQVTQTTNPFALSAIIGVGFPFISVLYIPLASPIRAWIHRGKNGKLLNRVIAVIFAALAAVVALR